MLRPVAGYGDAARRPPCCPPSRGTVTGRAVAERRPIHVHDLTAEPAGEYAEGNAYHRDLGLQHAARRAPPARGRAHRRHHAPATEAVQPFTDRQVELSKIFADQAAIAIDNARLFEELEGKTPRSRRARSTRCARSAR